MNRPDGIYRLDVRTREISLFPDTDELRWPKCGPRGMILVQRKSGLAPGPSFSLYRPERQVWEPLSVTDAVTFATFARDGRRFCGLAFPEVNEVACYSLPDGRKEVVAEIDEPLLPSLIPYMTLDANDDPIVIRDRSTREIYALEWEAP